VFTMLNVFAGKAGPPNVTSCGDLWQGRAHGARSNAHHLIAADPQVDQELRRAHAVRPGYTEPACQSHHANPTYNRNQISMQFSIGWSCP
jgi:hypothetical protein